MAESGMQFHGEYQHRIDTQGRVAVPARFRESFRGGIYLSKGLDPCVWAFSPEAWESWTSTIAATSPNLRHARVLRRMIFGSAFNLDLDRQGRVLIPQPLRRYAHLTEEVVLVGAGNFLELWDRRQWEEEELPYVEEAAARMADASEEGNR
jgi:MraZ protein